MLQELLLLSVDANQIGQGGYQDGHKDKDGQETITCTFHMMMDKQAEGDSRNGNQKTWNDNPKHIAKQGEGSVITLQAKHTYEMGNQTYGYHGIKDAM